MDQNTQRTAARYLRMERIIPSPVPSVWNAWTTEAGLARWWWSHWPDVEISADVRVGGGYRFAAPSAGIVVTGTYLEVNEASRLVFTWEWRDADGVQAGESVEVDFAAAGSGTLLTLVHSGPWTDDTAAESYRQGWAFVLDALARPS
jgi:uncharacterized protein YndB with AHSA1/START domain